MLSDPELIARVAQGDRDAFAEFYDRHAPRVLGLLTRLLPTRGDADDVLQDVFWQIWKTADRYDPDRGSVLVWLSLITRSRAMDWLRRQKPAAVPSEDTPAAWDPPSDRLEQTETATEVRNALEELPAEQREPIALAYYEGLPHAEIARRLQIPLGTAKTRIRSGMHRLRDRLRETVTPRVSLTNEVSP